MLPLTKVVITISTSIYMNHNHNFMWKNVFNVILS